MPKIYIYICGEFPKIRVYHVGGPYSRDYSVLPPILGNYHLWGVLRVPFWYLQIWGAIM